MVNEIKVSEKILNITRHFILLHSLLHTYINKYLSAKPNGEQWKKSERNRLNFNLNFLTNKTKNEKHYAFMEKSLFNYLGRHMLLLQAGEQASKQAGEWVSKSEKKRANKQTC